MKSKRLAYFRYSLLVAAILAASVLMKDLFGVAMFAGFEANRYVLTLFRSNKRWQSVTLWLCCLCALAVLVHFGESFLFLHSPYAMSHGRDAVLFPLIGMVFGLLAEYWSPREPVRAFGQAPMVERQGVA